MEVCSLPLSVRRIHLKANAVACALFVPTGLITVMLGPVLPALSVRWSLNDTQSGYLITAQFLGSLLDGLLWFCSLQDWFSMDDDYWRFAHGTWSGRSRSLPL